MGNPYVSSIKTMLKTPSRGGYRGLFCIKSSKIDVYCRLDNPKGLC